VKEKLFKNGHNSPIAARRASPTYLNAPWVQALSSHLNSSSECLSQNGESDATSDSIDSVFKEWDIDQETSLSASKFGERRLSHSEETSPLSPLDTSFEQMLAKEQQRPIVSQKLFCMLPPQDSVAFPAADQSQIKQEESFSIFGGAESLCIDSSFLLQGSSFLPSLNNGEEAIGAQDPVPTSLESWLKGNKAMTWSTTTTTTGAADAMV
jgi:hypothetical protein